MPSCPGADMATVSARAIRQGRGYIGGQRQFSALGAVEYSPTGVSAVVVIIKRPVHESME